MGKFNKELIVNIYSKLSIVIGLGIFIVLLIHFNSFPELMNGVVDKGLFNLDFTIESAVHVEVFNLPLILFTALFLFNLGVLIYIITGKKVETNIVVESMFYNTILSFLLIVAQVVFYYMIPETINGAIEIGLYQYEFVELSDLSTTGINFGYILAAIYTLYSIFVLFLETKRGQIDFK